MKEVRGFEPWEKQTLIARSLVKDQRVCVYTCNSAGKTTLASEIAHWFMSTRKDARVVLTAGVAPQVRLLWRKIRAGHASSKRPLPEPGPLKTPRWEITPEWFIDGIATDEEVHMQGYHSLGVDPSPGDDGGLLVIIDEASGVDAWVFNAIRGFMTSRNCYWLVMGNPNQANTEFHEISMRGNWTRYQISAFDCPDWLVSRDWIEEQREYWGEDSPQWQVRVLGQFPATGGDFLVFPLSLFEANADNKKPSDSPTHIGVDVARGNADRNTIVISRRDRVIHAEGFHSSDTMRLIDKLEPLVDKHRVRWENVHVDVIGIGAGVVDRLKQMGRYVDAVDFSARPIGDQKSLIGKHVRVRNRRAELYWAARCALHQGKASVPEVFRKTIWRECNLVQYDTNRDILTIEPKEKIRDRYEGQSPDFADAWVMTFSRSTRPRMILAA
jgi:phage terminase large subunit